jgi:hypothetical protein
LISHFRTKELLLELGVDLHVLKQKVFFKAQLYVPMDLNDNTFEVINNSCVIGCYIGMAEYLAMHDCYFYMPQKLDWLLTPHLDVKWLIHKEFTPYLEVEINQSRSPLCWVKDVDGILQKLFVVFWKNK